MQFTAGTTFLYPLGPTQTAHLWIIATDPDSQGNFAVVSCTSLKGAKDQTVILRQYEHPFLKWDTCVAYNLADIISCDQLEERISKGEARLHSPTTFKVLDLVRDGFLASDFTKYRVRDFVKNQK